MISILPPIKDTLPAPGESLAKKVSPRQRKLENLLTFAEECAILPGVRETWAADLEKKLLEAWEIPGGMMLVSVQKRGESRVLDINFLMGDLRSILWCRRYLTHMAKSKGCSAITFETDNKRLAMLADKVRYTGYWRV